MLKSNLFEDESSLLKVTEIFKILGDPTRIRILTLLMDNRLYVQQISDQLQMNHSAISHQLRILRQGRLVKSVRLGKTVHYSIIDNHIRKILYICLQHIEKERQSV
ncbi:metalloregulator ArsR/SmtB family transcription factor [Chitinispirillales bacterium ANBcel5]|uniref:ArsR/SmtB family transcription factor n=1 Tax=Cellulosispirillum alkaliphilum TaxID=3039283 RepID=UPI002A5685F0|nr:metalloregulator ArsR/SmtB family transcription factor [Chitinispirillales bacterium ANBcel5]